MVQGALYFDHCYPAERGYGYVGASRFRSSEGLWLFGKIRRTDWLPVKFGQTEKDQETRSALSVSSEEEMDEFEDDHASSDEWDEWDVEMEEGYADFSDDDFEQESSDEEGDEEPPDEREHIDWKKLCATKDATNEDLPESDGELSDEDISEEPNVHDVLLKFGAIDSENVDMPE